MAVLSHNLFQSIIEKTRNFSLKTLLQPSSIFGYQILNPFDKSAKSCACQLVPEILRRHLCLLKPLKIPFLVLFC